MAKPKLSAELIESIRTAEGRVVDVAERFGVSTFTVSKYRPVRSKHRILTESEQDAILAEFLSKVPTAETAARYGVSRHIIYRVRREGFAALLKGSGDGAA